MDFQDENLRNPWHITILRNVKDMEFWVDFWVDFWVNFWVNFCVNFWVNFHSFALVMATPSWISKMKIYVILGILSSSEM